MQGEESTLYRTCNPVVDVRFDPDDGPELADALVEALSQAANAEPTDLPPLYHAVDMDALSMLFSPDRSDRHQVHTFQYQQWQVFVRGDGRIRVCDARTSTDPEPVFGGSPDQ